MSLCLCFAFHRISSDCCTLNQAIAKAEVKFYGNHGTIPQNQQLTLQTIIEMIHSNIEQESEFSSLVRRHEKIIFSVCFFYASVSTPFDDLRQEVLISLFKSYDSFRRESSESTWVYRVAINTCLLSIRKFSPKVQTIPLEDVLSAVELPDRNDETLLQRLEWLHNSIADLNPLDKGIIIMWLDDMSYEEIGDSIGIPRNTVASRLYRIKDKLKSKKNI